jgi:predicted ATPase/DNA-binding XRE family transcriptional regulator
MVMAAPAFGVLLKTYRTQAGISQEQLAERAGVSASAVGALEQGLRRAPYRQTIALLSDALDLAEQDRKRLQQAADAARARGSRAVRPEIRLPQPFTSFIERSEVDEITRHLEERRFVTITGAGGIGKTRTSLQAARRLAERGMDCCFVDLSAVSDADGVWLAIAAAREVPSPGSESLPEAIRKNLATRPLLLVLDNCEHVIEPTAQIVQTLLADAPRLKLLATSRERLGLTSELVFRLPSMRPAAALRLLVERAEASDAHAQAAVENVDQLVEICRMLEGIPLAIELAAFHLVSMGPDQVRARLQEGLALLGPRDLPQRHQTMTAAIAWSFDLLEPTERFVMERIGVFSGGFTIDAAQQICGVEEVSAFDVAASLGRLAQKSLVQLDHMENAARYTLLETVRSYANEQLAARGLETAIRRRHAQWLAAVALDFSQARPRRDPASLACEMENMRAALRWALGSGEAEDLAAAGTIAGRLRLVWYARGRSEELQGWSERLLPLIDEADHPSAVAHLCVALVNCLHRDADATLRYGERALRLLQRTGESRLAASVCGQIAIRLAQRERAAEAEQLLASCSEWVESAAAYGTYDQLSFLHNRANVRRRLEQFDAARADLARVLEMADERADPDGQFRIYGMLTLAAVDFEAGDAVRATQLSHEVIDRYRPPNDESPFWLAIAFGQLASYQLALDAIDEAERCLLTSLRILRDLAADCDIFFLYFACILSRRGEYARAAQCLGFVDAWYERTGFTIGRIDAQFYASVVDTLGDMPQEEQALRRRLGAEQTFAEMSAFALASA